MKYCIQQKKKEGKNAGSKAVNDVNEILLTKGYLPLNVYERVFYYISLIRIACKLKKNDHVFLQWPMYFIPTKPLVKLIVKRKTRLTLLLHDINKLRGIKENSGEDELLDYAERIIAHTPAMKNYLINQKINPSKIDILYSFDYLTDDLIPQRTCSNEIVYAGNLLKSTFLQQIPQNSYSLKFNCYGLPDNVLPIHLNYKGAFNPENVSVLQGSWGLVWDGDSVETCNGLYGKYLRLNSPHKVSLYLVSGLPIIIWKEAALADYIVSNNLGFAIESLSEIPLIIDKISESDYNQMLEAVKKEGVNLREGKHLLSILNSKQL